MKRVSLYWQPIIPGKKEISVTVELSDIKDAPNLAILTITGCSGSLRWKTFPRFASLPEMSDALRNRIEEVALAYWNGVFKDNEANHLWTRSYT